MEATNQSGSSGPSSGHGLLDQLVDEGLIDAEELRKLQKAAAREDESVLGYLIKCDVVSGDQIGQVAASSFGFDLQDLDHLEQEQEAIDLVTTRLVEKHRVLPLYKRGRYIWVAISDPTNMESLDEIRFATGLTVEPVLVEADKLGRKIEGVINQMDLGGADGGMDEDLDAVDIGSGEQEDPGADVSRADIDDAPVVRFVNKALLDAIHRGASDIHFEPFEKYMRLRYRMDGVLHEVRRISPGMAHRLIARIKVMGRMDISERRLPHDGRIRMKLSRGRPIDFRVSTCPTAHGEKAVLRILDPTAADMDIEDLGFEPIQKQRYLDALARPHGMILVTGPTGSGKTVSLYTGLTRLNEEHRNISTAEDPVEIDMPGVNQVSVNSAIGLSFANALRAFLRQDPDVVMVGEIRDLETAEIAVKAAQTGHLVLSTLHTNDAPQTLTRLEQIGVPAYNVVNAVSLIIAQRLGRRLCKHCKRPADLPRESLIEAGFDESEVDDLTVYRAVGCDECNHTGYKGRVGIYEVLPMDQQIGELVMAGADAYQIERKARDMGINSIRDSALQKVREGATTIEEIDRVSVV